MLRRKHESYPMAFVRQKCLATLQRFQHAAFTLHAQVVFDAAMSRDQNHQRFRLVRIEMVKHKIPAVLRGGRDDPFNILDKILFRSCRIQHRCNDLAGRNIQVAEQTRRTMTLDGSNATHYAVYSRFSTLPGIIGLVGASRSNACSIAVWGRVFSSILTV